MKTTITVKGMKCAGCKAGVENAVRRLPGVTAAEADLAKANLAVEFDEKQSTLEAVKAAVAKAGFKTE